MGRTEIKGAVFIFDLVSGDLSEEEISVRKYDHVLGVSGVK